MKTSVEIKYLAECPEVIPVLASWAYAQWAQQYCIKSVDEMIEQFAKRTNRDRIPLALVAFLDSQPIGTASLKIQEMTTHKHFYHWLGSVYVAKEHRNQGIGTMLVNRAVEETKGLGVKILYLHTPDKEQFYLMLGWEPVERPIYYNHRVVIMKRELAA